LQVINIIIDLPCNKLEDKQHNFSRAKNLNNKITQPTINDLIVPDLNIRFKLNLDKVIPQFILRARVLVIRHALYPVVDDQDSAFSELILAETYESFVQEQILTFQVNVESVDVRLFDVEALLEVLDTVRGRLLFVLREK
jgi:hypothetical protein